VIVNCNDWWTRLVNLTRRLRRLPDVTDTPPPPPPIKAGR
jgi:hypothetical protein